MQDFSGFSPLDLIGLISKSFYFLVITDHHPDHSYSAFFRVIAVAFDESSDPEICLLDLADPESNAIYYRSSSLKVNLTLQNVA